MNKETDIQEELFEIKQKFLREIPHPKLIKKQLDILEKKFGVHVDATEVELPHDLTDFFAEYLKILMPIKLEISNAGTAPVLAQSIQNLFSLQNKLIDRLFDIDCNIPVDTNVKQSEAFDVYDYIKEIGNHGLKENEIMDYLCRQFKTNERDLSALAKGVIRAHLIRRNGR